MQKPMIHLGGSSAESLSNGYQEAHSALIAALEKLGDAAPNGRDYYPMGDSAFQTAKKEHEARVAALMTVKKELEELTIHCADYCV